MSTQSSLQQVLVKYTYELYRTHTARVQRICITMQTCVVDNLYLARTKPVCVNEQRAHGPAMHILSGAQSMGVVTMANKIHYL